MKHKLLSVLLVLALLTGCLGGMSITASAATATYGDFVVETEVADGCSYAEERYGGCLTIKNAGTYTVSMATGQTADRIVVDAEGVTLVLNNVTIESKGNPALTLKHNATIRAEGTVDLKATNNGTRLYPGIDASGTTMTFLDGVLKTIGTTYHGGADGGSGIVGNLIMQGGTLEARGNEGTSTGYLYTADDGGAGIYGDVTVCGGNLTVYGGNGGNGAVGGNGGNGINGKLTVLDGTVTVTGGVVGKSSDADPPKKVSGYAVTGAVQIERGTVTATGGWSQEYGGYQQAFYSVPVVGILTKTTIRAGDPLGTTDIVSAYSGQTYAQYVVLRAYPIYYEQLDGLFDGPDKFAEGEQTTIPNPTKVDHHFAGWQVNGTGEPVKDLVLDGTLYTDAVTLTANWTEKEPFTFEAQPQTYTYNGQPQAFVPDASLPDVTVEYMVDGSWVSQAPTDAGSYDVSLFKPETDVYKSYRLDLTGGLTITKALPQVTAPTAIRGLMDNDQSYALITAGSTTGGVMEYSLDGETWSTEIPEASEPGKYTVSYRVAGGKNYLDIAPETVKVEIFTAVDDCTGGGSCALASYKDATPNNWYHDGMHYCLGKDIIRGYGDGRLGPNDQATRSQVVTLLWRAAGSPAPVNTESPFKDVTQNDFYYDAVLWAVENGITNGTSATKFSPNAVCSRSQVVTFLWRAAGSPAPTETACTFADVSQDAFYYNAVLWAVENGITKGINATTFAPDDGCTRSQIAVFLYRSIS